MHIPDPIDSLAAEVGAVLRFWFEETPAACWFEKNPVFDATIQERFGALHAQAAAGGCAYWAANAEGALALLVLLDQVSRNLYRDNPRGFDLTVPVERRVFFYLPLAHSEDLAHQERCCRLVRERIGDALYVDAAKRHRDVIARFGRFPHRNKALGRPSTPAEEDYLSQPGAGF